MSILLWIILGILAGWIADRITRSSDGVFEDITLGIIGAFIGGFIMSTIGRFGVTQVSLYGLFVAVIGAILLIGTGRFFHKSQREGHFL